VVARHEFSVPDAMVMRHIAHQVEHARESMRRQGVDPDKLPWDYGKLISELRPESEKAVKRALLLEAIAEREAINPAEDEVDTEIERFAQAAQRPAQAVRRMMEKSGDLESLRRGLREKKTLDFLIQHAKVGA
jgi:trigger factor